MLAAALCLLWLCAEGALAHTGTSEPHDVGDVADLVADDQRSEADEPASDGSSVSPLDVPDTSGDAGGVEGDDVPVLTHDAGVDPAPESDGATTVGPTGGAAPSMLRFVASSPDATTGPTPLPSTEPAPDATVEPTPLPSTVPAPDATTGPTQAQPTVPAPVPPTAPAPSPEPSRPESTPIASSPAVAPPEQKELHAPAAPPNPRAVVRASDPAPAATPASGIRIGDPVSAIVGESGDPASPPAGASAARSAVTAGDTAASSISPRASRDAAPAARAIAVRGGTVTSAPGVIHRPTVGYSAVVRRSAPARGGSQLVSGGGLAEDVLDDTAAPDGDVGEAISRSGPLTATVTLPGGSAPYDGPLARIADYLMYGGATASGAPPILLAVVAPAEGWPGAPPLAGGSIVGIGAGSPRPAHAHPLRRPG